MKKYIVYPVDPMHNIDKWAKETLNVEELSQYQSAAEANGLLWQSYQDQGLFTLEELYETVYSATLNSNITITIGSMITFANEEFRNSLKRETNYESWCNRYVGETGESLPILLETEIE